MGLHGVGAVVAEEPARHWFGDSKRAERLQQHGVDWWHGLLADGHGWLLWFFSGSRANVWDLWGASLTPPPCQVTAGGVRGRGRRGAGCRGVAGREIGGAGAGPGAVAGVEGVGPAGVEGGEDRGDAGLDVRDLGDTEGLPRVSNGEEVAALGTGDAEGKGRPSEDEADGGEVAEGAADGAGAEVGEGGDPGQGGIGMEAGGAGGPVGAVAQGAIDEEAGRGQQFTPGGEGQGGSPVAARERCNGPGGIRGAHQAGQGSPP